MPRKKSGKRSAQQFVEQVEAIEDYCREINQAGLPASSVSTAYDAALINLVSAFEKFVLDILAVAVNNDTTTISQRTGVAFPRHLTHDVCKYLITGSGYFDWRGGRPGLIKVAKTYLPDQHWLVIILQDTRYKDSLDRLLDLRHHAAHNSTQSRRKLLATLKIKHMGTAGSWVKVGNRMTFLNSSLKALGKDVEAKSPF